MTQTETPPALAAAPSESKRETGLMLGALMPTWLALGWLVSKAQWYWSTRPDMHFGWIVLMLSAFLVWDQWAKLPQGRFEFRWPVLLLGLAGAALLFLVQIYQAAFGTSPALMMGLAMGVFAVCGANIFYVFGWPGMKFFAFPVLFLTIAMPLPSAIYNPVVGGLQAKVTWFNVELLNLVGIPAQKVGSLINLPNGTVGVDEACSGIRSLQSTIMATLFIGYLTLKSRALQVFLLGAGVALAVVGNLIRSFYQSVTANSQGLQAVEKVHDSAGWSILLFTAGGVALLAWLFSKGEKWAEQQQKELEQEDAEASSAAA